MATLCLVVVGLFIAFSCEKPPIDSGGNDTIKNPEPELTLEGTKWKLEGIVDVETGTMKVLEPTGCDYCYTFVFADNFSSLPVDTFIRNNGDTLFWRDYAFGHSRDNNFWLLSLNPITFASTKVGETGDGKVYYDAMFKVNSYMFNKNELKFFYNENYTRKYLLYKSVDTVLYPWGIIKYIFKQ
jgi:hypothetical protein